jgi:hypothetical protein
MYLGSGIRQPCVDTRSELVEGSVRDKPFHPAEHLFRSSGTFDDVRAEFVERLVDVGDGTLDGVESVFCSTECFVDASTPIQELLIGGTTLGPLERVLGSNQTLIDATAQIVEPGQGAETSVHVSEQFYCLRVGISLRNGCRAGLDDGAC